ncbi:hypothetical protein [Spongiibacter sp.]|uniref:hypothetical protein n=1 Tax=Spongiibacter sp. TaxID=2024860 RepID=UPI00356AC75C
MNGLLFASKPVDLSRRSGYRQRQGGFIITVELILITTIVIIGSLAGISAIRDALRDYSADKAGSVALVRDANGVILGPAVDYDEHEAPRIPYIDRSVLPLAPDPAHRNYRALIGVRDDRFTGREPVYYSGGNCTGTPCIKVAGDEATDSRGLDGNLGGGSVGYIYALQGGPTYAIGSSPDGIKGFLFRQAPQACPIDAAEIRSRYVSQKVVSGSPCEAFAGGGPTEPHTDCLVSSSIADALPCECPAGYEDKSDLLSAYLPEIESRADRVFAQINNDNVIGKTISTLNGGPLVRPEVGKICCPLGAPLEAGNIVDTVVYLLAYNSLLNISDDNTLTATLVERAEIILASPPINLAPGELKCLSNLRLALAESVPHPDDAERNALEFFQTPFSIALPADVVGQNSSGGPNWIYTAPRSEAP